MIGLLGEQLRVKVCGSAAWNPQQFLALSLAVHITIANLPQSFKKWRETKL